MKAFKAIRTKGLASTSETGKALKTTCMEERFRHIAENWFLTEPLLFNVYCSHKLCALRTEEQNSRTVLRCGKGRIEYNPARVAELEQIQLEEYLRLEMIRILLKHPYQRQPQPVRKDVCYWASDLVLQDHYKPKVRIFCRDDFQGIAFPGYAAAFEEYYRSLLPLSQSYSGMSDEHAGAGEQESENQDAQQDQQEEGHVNDEEGRSGGAGSPNENTKSPKGLKEGDTASTSAKQSSPTGGGKGENEPEKKMTALQQMQEKAGQAAELWDEDQLMQEEINRMVEVAEQTQAWGSLKGRMKEMIVASTQAKVDASRILNGFRGSLISSRRQLTRMRPSRRYGFDNMGSRHQFSTRLLVAVDVSGSVPSESLRQFFGMVNRFFKYGIEKIDVIQFDSDIKGEPLSLKRALKEVAVLGRAGTNYQAVMDYACQDGDYDGLIICTDGFAALPRLKKNIRTKILWVFNNRAFFERHGWVSSFPNSRSCFLDGV